VPEHGEVRTFAVERITRLTVLDERLDGARVLADVFTHSPRLRACPSTSSWSCAPRVAPYVRERQWHQSQQTREQADGSIRMTLEVSDDWSLRSWVLSSAPVRVGSPPGLAQAIRRAGARAGTVRAADGVRDAERDVPRRRRDARCAAKNARRRAGAAALQAALSLNTMAPAHNAPQAGKEHDDNLPSGCRS
jgi:hypothetical protein